jgi:hypothetical protein
MKLNYLLLLFFSRPIIIQPNTIMATTTLAVVFTIANLLSIPLRADGGTKVP